LVSFSLAQRQNVSLKLFDMNGRLILTLADRLFEAGENKLMWNSDDMNAGVYILQLRSSESLMMKKLICLCSFTFPLCCSVTCL